MSSLGLSEISPNAAGGAKINLRAAALLSAIIWGAHLSVIITSALPFSTSAAPSYQMARVLIAGAGFLLSIGIHLAMPAQNQAHFFGVFFRALLLCAPAAFVLTVYSHFQFQWFAPPGAELKELWADVAFSLAYYLWIFVSWAAFYAGVHAMRQAEVQGRRVAEIEARAHEAQLMALRYQLNPHFFFNVLNTLSGLVSADRRAEAEGVIIGMADFLRYSLKGAPTAMAPLSDEGLAQRTYLDIERIRFGGRLVVETDIAPDCASAPVPALILQPLVENAVKHAVGKSEAPVTIIIGARREHNTLICWVENSPIAETTLEAAGFGVGLRNVAQRLHAIYGDSASLEAGPSDAGGWRSTLRLPFAERPGPCVS